MPHVKVNPESIRTVNPSSWPQFPYNDSPRTPEQSQPRFSIFPEYAKRFKLRDGVELAYDVFRPFAPEEKFPALAGRFGQYPLFVIEKECPSNRNLSGEIGLRWACTPYPDQSTSNQEVIAKAKEGRVV